MARIGRDDAAKLAPAVYRAITSRTKINLKYIVSDLSAPMRALDIIMTHPSAKDVIKLWLAEADEEIQTFALDDADEGFCEGMTLGSSISRN